VETKEHRDRAARLEKKAEEHCHQGQRKVWWAVSQVCESLSMPPEEASDLYSCKHRRASHKDQEKQNLPQASLDRVPQEKLCKGCQGTKSHRHEIGHWQLITKATCA